MIRPYRNTFALDVYRASGGGAVDGVVTEAYGFVGLAIEGDASFFPGVGTSDGVGELGEAGPTFPDCGG